MSWSIEELIENKRIEIFGFLITSPYTNMTNGIEAVSKGIHPDGKGFIPFNSMMEKAIPAKKEAELQFLCLDMTIEKFAEAFDPDDKIILFVNISEDMIVLGPSVSGVSRVNKIYYFQIIIKFRNKEKMREILNNVSDLENNNKVNISIDINPC